MAAIFAGASHALLASIVFAFEATRQPLGLLPLLAGCSAAYLVSVLTMRTSIMTEKLARRGAPVRTEYAVDFFSQILVREVMTREVIALRAADAVDTARGRLSSELPQVSHQGFPVVDDAGRLVGVVTRRNIVESEAGSGMLVGDVVSRRPVVTHADNTLREAADHMVREKVGRLPVIDRTSGRMVGIVTRSDLLAAHERRLQAAQVGR
jgi:CBS domain-containing protein